MVTKSKINTVLHKDGFLKKKKKTLLAHKTFLNILGQYVKHSSPQGTWEKLVSDMRSKVLSSLVTSLISKELNLMLPKVILILIGFHYFARSSLYSTEMCTVKRILADSLELRACHHQLPRVQAGQWKQR